jgi:hypothetical protein
MKKIEPFKASAMAAALLKKYAFTERDAEENYFNPDKKKEGLKDATDALYKKILNVSERQPSFDEITQMAIELVNKCKAEPEKPKYDKTKRQIYEDIVAELEPLLRDELVGKCFRYKRGAHNFTFFKVDTIKVEIAIYDRLYILIEGPGYEFTLDSSNNISGFPDYKRNQIECTDVLLLDGKDSHLGAWLDIISPDEFRERFIAAYEVVARTIGISIDDTVSKPKQTTVDNGK